MATSDDGFSLLEVLVAVSILVTVALSLMQLLLLSSAATRSARSTTIAVTLAAQKIEQLRALALTFDAAGAPITDTTTDVTANSPVAGGGGLGPSPESSLTVDTQGFVDYLDANGGWLGNSALPPPGAAFVRRWSIEPASPGSDTLIFQVVVVRIGAAGSQDVSFRSHGEKVRFATARTRKAT